MRSKVDGTIMVDGWPMINCTLMRLPHCEVVSELEHYHCVYNIRRFFQPLGLAYLKTPCLDFSIWKLGWLIGEK